MKKYLLLLFSFCMLLLLPNIGSYLRTGALPEGYGLFPAQQVKGVPPFHQPYFVICAAVAVAIVIFLLFPNLFGFKKTTKPPSTAKVVGMGYPKWFYPSLVVTLVSWFLMWARLEIFEPLDHFTFVPLWWGFIMVLDGFVYKRNNGKSLASVRPNTLKLLAVVSCFSWFVFEYQNFFVLGNWYYPNNEILTNFGNISWQLLSYTTVLPAIFNWYFLLRTFPAMDTRYSNGPVIRIGNTGQYIFFGIALVLMVLMAYFPYELFWMLWVSLIPLFVPVMIIGKYWNPFTEIGRRGDYSYVILIAIATLINGFFWEFWNFGSEWIHDIPPTNPNYWKYSVPYLDKYHIFSEMPILGYFGYLLFGICCWVLWLLVAYLLDFDYRISLSGKEDA